MTIDEIKKLLASHPNEDHLANTARRHLEDLEFVLAQLAPHTPKAQPAKEEKVNG
jgi:hypothetical protein